MAARVLWFDECKKEEWEEGPPLRATRYFRAEVSELQGAITALRLHRPDLQRFQPHQELDCHVDPGPKFELVEGTRMYEITVPYTSEVTEDPLDRPVDVDWHTWHTRELITRDPDGKPILTAAGEVISGIEEDVDYLGLTCVKNVAAVPAWVLRFRGAVNEDDITIDGIQFPQHTLRIADLRITKAEENDVEFRRVQLELLHREETWQRYFPNAGYYCLQTVEIPRSRPRINFPGQTVQLRPLSVRKYVRILDDQGEPTQQPEFLSAEGERITEPIKGPDGRPLVNGNNQPRGRVLKRPLDPEDLIYLPTWTRKRLPYSELTQVLT